MKPSYYLGVLALVAAGPVVVFAQVPSLPPTRMPLVPPPELPAQPLPTPAPLPAPAPVPPAATSASKFAVLKDNSVVEGVITEIGDKITIRRGAIDSTYPREEVLFIGAKKEDVYLFQKALVPAGDANARIKLAKWCVFNGLREQALAEARTVLRDSPTNITAQQLVRSLEESLRKFPPPGKPAAPPEIPPSTSVKPATEPDPDLEVSIEASNAFRLKVQPILTNLCADCHARPNAAAFKLARLDEFDTNPNALRQNFRAVMNNVRKDDPLASPFLIKAYTPHGGMKEPAFRTRQAVAFVTLTDWVQSVGHAPPPPAVPQTGPIPVSQPQMPPAQPSPTGLPPVPPPPGVSKAAPEPAVEPPVVPANFGGNLKPPEPSGPPVDEFDPAAFNRTVPPNPPGGQK